MKRLFVAAVLLVSMAAPLAAQDREDAAWRKVESQLASTVIQNFSVTDLDVQDVVKDLARRARVTIVFDRKALADVAEEDRRITLELVDIKASNVLNIVLDQVKLTRTFRNGILYLTTAEKAQGVTVTRVYDVNDITMLIQDFPAPRLRLKSEDAASSGPIVEIPKEPPPTTDDIVALIEDSIKADWGGKARVSIMRGNLVVRAPREVQLEVVKLLGSLRGSR